MKAVVSSDWHLDWATAGHPRGLDVMIAIGESVDHAVEIGADLYIFTGDLTDPYSPRTHAAVSTAVQTATHLWIEHGIMSRWLVGNHDVIEDGSGSHTLDPLHGLAVGLGGRAVGVFSNPSREVFEGDLTVVALPFVARSHAYDPALYVSHVEAPNPGRVIVLGHLNIEGIESGSESSEMARGREVFLPIDEIRKRWPNAVIVNGHYHKRQLFNGVQVPGSLERLTFGEDTNEPGFLVVEA